MDASILTPRSDDAGNSPGSERVPVDGGGSAQVALQQQAVHRRDAARAPAAKAAAGSPGNALKHGLTAAKLLPHVLRSDRLAQLRQQLTDEYRPQTVIARLLVDEAARHAAALEVVEVAEPAVRRHAVQALDLVMQAEATGDDWQLAAAVTGEPLERCSRYRRMHERGFYQALAKLEQLRESAGGAAATAKTTDVATARFASCSDCEQYLRQHTFSAGWRCPACSSTSGHWLEGRRLWQCADCRKQYGLREGTVFARSRLALVAWFTAIRAYAANTHIDATTLSQATGVTRLATVRSMLQRIAQAVEDGDLTRGLAGLTRYPLVLPSHSNNAVRGTLGSSRGQTDSHPSSAGHDTEPANIPYVSSLRPARDPG